MSCGAVCAGSGRGRGRMSRWVMLWCGTLRTSRALYRMHGGSWFSSVAKNVPPSVRVVAMCLKPPFHSTVSYNTHSAICLVTSTYHHTHDSATTPGVWRRGRSSSTVRDGRPCVWRGLAGPGVAESVAESRESGGRLRSRFGGPEAKKGRWITLDLSATLINSWPSSVEGFFLFLVYR